MPLRSGHGACVYDLGEGSIMVRLLSRRLVAIIGSGLVLQVNATETVGSLP